MIRGEGVVNAFAGTKLAPSPSEWGFSVPAWVPLFDPFTVIVPIVAASPPRKLICVFSDAVSVPGTG